MSSGADDFAKLAGEFDGPWEIWRRDDGIICAWLVNTNPPLLVRAATIDELREVMKQATGR
jgi:hypothetical protein